MNLDNRTKWDVQLNFIPTLSLFRKVYFFSVTHNLLTGGRWW